MTTIKSYTDLEQSKKLAEILPIETADMFLAMNGILPVMSKYIDSGFVTADETAVPCWSLAALLSVLPKIGAEEPMVGKLYYASKPVERYICEYSLTNMTSEYNNPVDACVEMVEKLNEFKML